MQRRREYMFCRIRLLDPVGRSSLTVILDVRLSMGHDSLDYVFQNDRTDAAATMLACSHRTSFDVHFNSAFVRELELGDVFCHR